MANAIPFHRAARKLGDVSEQVFVDILGETIAAIEAVGIEYVLIGGVGSASLGRPRWTHDIDVLVRPDDADGVLEALDAASFETERTNEHWIFKALKRRVVVDVIFRTVGDIYLDDSMRARLGLPARAIEQGSALRPEPPHLRAIQRLGDPGVAHRAIVRAHIRLGGDRRNVAQSVIRYAYGVYAVEDGDRRLESTGDGYRKLESHRKEESWSA